MRRSTLVRIAVQSILKHRSQFIPARDRVRVRQIEQCANVVHRPGCKNRYWCGRLWWNWQREVWGRKA